jgi:hypothetical protein
MVGGGGGGSSIAAVDDLGIALAAVVERVCVGVCVGCGGGIIIIILLSSSHPSRNVTYPVRASTLPSEAQYDPPMLRLSMRNLPDM